jgi:hypothetical protein
LIPLIRCGGGPVNLKVLMLLYPIHTTMSTEEIKQKKEKKLEVDTEAEVVGDEGVKKEKKDKKRKDREEEEVKPAEVSSSGEIIGETKEQRKARKKAKKEVRFNSLLGDSTDDIGKESRSGIPGDRTHPSYGGQGRKQGREESTS